jgi:hypothetical protein
MNIIRTYIKEIIASTIVEVIIIRIGLINNMELKDIIILCIFVVLFFIGLLYIMYIKFHKTVGIKKYLTKRKKLNLKKIINSAKDSIDFLGISGKSLFDISNMQNILRDKKSKGIKFRFLLLDPESVHLQEKAKEEKISGNANHWKSHINESCTKLLDSGMKTNEIKYYNSKPIWNILRVDNRIFLSYYGYGSPGKEFPVIEIEDNINRSTLYTPIKNQFEYLWEKEVEKDKIPVFIKFYYSSLNIYQQFVFITVP